MRRPSLLSPLGVVVETACSDQSLTSTVPLHSAGFDRGHAMRRFIAPIALALLAFAPFVVEGCHSDSIGDPAQSVVGTYSLASVDGAPIPFTLIPGDPKVEVVSDEINLASGGTFIQRTSFRVTRSGMVTTQDQLESGTYMVSGSTLSFRFSSDNSTVRATLAGSTFTIGDGGHALVYVRL
jgi:hypothetical protein